MEHLEFKIKKNSCLRNFFKALAILYLLKHLVSFLPKNSTSKPEPNYAGVIRNYKANYFYNLMSNIVSIITHGINIETVYKQFNLKYVIIYISYGRNDVTAKTF